VKDVLKQLSWLKLYPDSGEDISKDLPTEKGPRVSMTVYVDFDHAHDLVTRRSITGIIVNLNYICIRWVSKLQKTLETSN
jgi:hypothetical protein